MLPTTLPATTSSDDHEQSETALRLILQKSSQAREDLKRGRIPRAGLDAVRENTDFADTESQRASNRASLLSGDDTLRLFLRLLADAGFSPDQVQCIAAAVVASGLIDRTAFPVE